MTSIAFGIAGLMIGAIAGHAFGLIGSDVGLAAAVTAIVFGGGHFVKQYAS